MKSLRISLSKYENAGARRKTAWEAADRKAVMEFHINQNIRLEYGLEHALFTLTGNIILPDFHQVRRLTARLNAKVDGKLHPERILKAGQLNAMGLIDEILHFMVALYREQVQPDIFETALSRLENNLGSDKTARLLQIFCEQFPPKKVYSGELTAEEYLKGSEDSESCRALALEEVMLLSLANINPAFSPFRFLFDDKDLEKTTIYTEAISELRAYLAELPPFGPDGMNLWDLLRSPALASPDSLSGQLDYMRRRWGLLLGKFLARILTGLDVIKEENKPSFFGPGPSEALTFTGMDEYERFSPDQDWMPRTVLIAKSTLVWLYQLTKKYNRPIKRLDQIPDEELDELARRGFTGLWLIGLWERSNASKTIKQWTGNPEAAASAYSLYDYDIAGELGGWDSLANLRERCFRRGVHLGSDMVPNHTGIDSRWVMEYPDRFLQLRYPPFPTYTFNGGNLSNRDGIGIYIEDHYYNRTDAAVVFKRVDFSTGDIRYIYHGNDGTSMPWNDTAQIDFLNPEAREAVIRTIIGVCQQFSIVRFDAAMTLAKRHIQRLWYPEPGHGGDIASRSEQAISSEEFNRRIPNEFWREVVDRCASEAPNTLLLAEAFWMMEGYFVRTLGMHRVYNSAFMNMLKTEENAKYRATIKNTLEFDPEVLKRFVNFMNNPDEETAVAQFGKGDKYFGICTLLVTMPGLPMFGHGQIEGFEEKYGMEYRRSYREEKPDQYLVDRHEREIFPLMKRRQLFSGSAEFCLYDLYTHSGTINENIFAYSNRLNDDRALVFYNNAYPSVSGWIFRGAVAIPNKSGGFRQDTLSQALSLHSESQYFTLLREQRSNLWFIRSSKDISERGLFISLRGYEAQVFLDIHEIEDDYRGRWARLHAELNGRGVGDLKAGIQDIFLGELYESFTELFKPQFIEELYRFFVPEKSEKGTPQITMEFIKSVETANLDFINGALKFLDGAGGRYDPFVTEGQYKHDRPELIAKELSAYYERLASLAAYRNSAARKDDTPALKFLHNLGKTIIERPRLAAFAAGYGVLSLLRSILSSTGEASGAEAAALLDHWNLDRKLREVYTGLGITDDEAYKIVEIMKAVLARTRPAKPEPEIPNAVTKTVSAENEIQKAAVKKTVIKSLSDAASLVLENYEAEDFRRLLQINLFEDTVWFNKEAFEDVLFYASLFMTLESGAAFKKTGTETNAEKEDWIDRVEKIQNIHEAFSKAEAKSDYKLEELVTLL
jgi:hypothetical protein